MAGLLVLAGAVELDWVEFLDESFVVHLLGQDTLLPYRLEVLREAVPPRALLHGLLAHGSCPAGAEAVYFVEDKLLV